MRIASIRALAIVTALAGAPLFEHTALAAPTGAELAEARARFQQALAAQAAGDWAGALALLERVAAVATTPQVRFNIALCQEHLGKLSSALGNYRIAATVAHDANAPDVEKQSNDKVAALSERLPKLTITRGPTAAAARIVLDGTELGTTALGHELPVDPGPHQIDVRPASGGKATTTVVELAEGEHRSVVAALEAEAQPAPAPAQTVTAPPPEENTSGGGSALVPIGFGVAGVGVIVGTITGILMFSKRSALDDTCTANKECPPSAHGDLSSAYTMATISTVSFVVAGVGAGVAIVGLVTKKKATTSARVEPWIGVGAAGARGTF